MYFMYFLQIIFIDNICIVFYFICLGVYIYLLLVQLFRFILILFYLVLRHVYYDPFAMCRATFEHKW